VVGVLAATAVAKETAEERTILNQKSLSFVLNEVTRLLGPTEQPIALHRILGIDQSLAIHRPSQDNRLILVNPHRVLFDEFGFVDTGEFLATTVRVHNRDGAPTAVTAETIQVSEHGYVALMTPGVATEAVVIAAINTEPADAERKILFDFMSDGLIRYAVGESELGQFTGVDGKALAKASSDGARSEAGPGQMLLNARSAADIQRSVMNTGNVPRARRLVVANGSIRLEGESPLVTSVRPAREPSLDDHALSKRLHADLDRKMLSGERATAMVTPIPPALNHDAAAGPDFKSSRMSGASSRHQSPDRKSVLAKKATPTEPTIQHAGKTKPRKSPSLSHQPQSPPWSSIPGGLPEWMKYLPKTEGTSESPALP
jgi:hypothetical protein